MSVPFIHYFHFGRCSKSRSKFEADENQPKEPPLQLRELKNAAASLERFTLADKARQAIASLREIGYEHGKLLVNWFHERRSIKTKSRRRHIFSERLGEKKSKKLERSFFFNSSYVRLGKVIVGKPYFPVTDKHSLDKSSSRS